MILYAESSAILAWLLREDRSQEIRAFLSTAEIVLTSDLTLIECDRCLVRAAALGEVDERDANERRVYLEAAAGHWLLLRIDSVIVERSRRAFPVEPVRSLDAIHLASILVARAVAPEVALLSLDDRIRANARALEITTLPD